MKLTSLLLSIGISNKLLLAQIFPSYITTKNIPTSQQAPKTPSTLSPNEEPILPSTSPSIPLKIPQQNQQQIIKVKAFIFQGNTVINSQYLEKVVAPFIGKKLSFSDLTKVTEAVTNYYVKKGYINSGAYLPIAENRSLRIDNAVVTIAILEGEIEQINIVGSQHLQNYIHARIPQPILNNQRLLAALQLLRQDPLIEKISASLKEGTAPGKAILTIYVSPRQKFKVNVTLDNYRSPAVGSFQRRIDLSDSNLLGLGDALNVVYSNTDGSNAIATSYSVPLNPHNSTLSLSYANVSSNIIERPFTALDILSNARAYEVSFRQPLLRQASRNSAQELTLGLTASKLETESSIQNTPFPLSVGADANGRTRVLALRFFQDWSERNTQGALVVRSEFSWGLDAFDATINTSAPDGRFFHWQGEAAWLRRLGDTSLLVRTRLQLADRPLPALEQISLGGISTVRGYRQDVFLADNGFFLSSELRIPAWKTDTQELQIIPFFDLGTAWNNHDSDISNATGTLASVGLGIQYRSDRFNARLDWGIPLNQTNSNLRTWQENGVYFSLNYQLF